MSAAEIVNTLEKAWKIIDDNKPSSQITSARANAVPKVEDWTTVAGAMGPRETRWYRKMTNSLPVSWGDIVIDFEIILRYTYGATYRGGGRYITNIWIDVADSYVSWFHSLELTLEAKDPENAGSASAPLARIPISIRGKMESPKANITLQKGFMIYGDGRLEVLSD
ncbi:MAG: hypothetical protein ABI894_14475 [Ilumatobacteraceae bacterium]